MWCRWPTVWGMASSPLNLRASSRRPPGRAPLPQADVVALHHALAVDTRAAVLGGPTDAQGPWTAYWRPDQAGGFGHYGRGRRDYGRGQGPWGGAFEAFAQDRVEATLCASRAFLRLLAQEIGRSSVE